MLLCITGGTGSLGQAILEQQIFLKDHGITKIRVLSRDEQKQITLMRNYTGKIRLDCFLADVADKERMKFGLKDAHFVIHAAAQKHIDKFELDVPQGFKTNISGTQNVAEGFLESKNAVSAILVTTDKAVSPITSYGVSKLAAQNLWLWNNRIQGRTAFGVALYGNVFASRGSVIELWTERAKKGLPLPLTDLQATRFFITMEEAAKFVLQTLFLNKRKVQIPPMKSAYMTDVGRTIWNYWRKEETLQFEPIPMREREKQHEILEVDGMTSETCEKWTFKELDAMYEQWVKDKCLL